MGFESLRGSQYFPAEALAIASPGLPKPSDLAPIARLLRSLDPVGAPVIAPVCGAPLEAARRVIALPGSFNPPHAAHLALIRAAQALFRADTAVWLLSVRTVDKERVTGMLLEDRLWLLCQLLRSEALQQNTVAATNRGLYFEQALALHDACPALQALAFVAGYDKIVQIFDGRYYTDRESALRHLFSKASFLVAPRDTATETDLTALLARPENAPYADGVTILPVHGSLAHVSSTRVRDEGDLSDVPALVAQFVESSGCYDEPPNQVYGARHAALEAVARGQR